MIKNKIKISGLFFLSIAVIYLKNPFFLIVLLALLVIFGLFVISPEKFRSRIFPLIFFGFVIILIQIFLGQGNYVSRVFQGFIAVVKIFILSLSVFLFVETTSMSKILELFSFLPKSMRLLITITFSFIPCIFQEGKKIIIIQQSRGLNLKNLNFVKNIIPVMIPLIHRSLNRAEQIALVIESRGWRG